MVRASRACCTAAVASACQAPTTCARRLRWRTARITPTISNAATMIANTIHPHGVEELLLDAAGAAVVVVDEVVVLAAVVVVSAVVVVVDSVVVVLVVVLDVVVIWARRLARLRPTRTSGAPSNTA